MLNRRSGRSTQRRLGGWIGHGFGQVATSAYLMLGEQGGPGSGIWPLTLYPGIGRGGVAEVVVGHGPAGRAAAPGLTLAG